MTTQQLIKSDNGFTLIELLVATLIGLFLASVAGSLLISHIKSSERAESLERQRNEWSRTAGFIEAEITLSERVFGASDTTPGGDLLITIPAECTITQSQFRLGLDQSRSLDPIIYAIKPSNSGWLGDNTLWRCGPPIGLDGRLESGTPIMSQILDGLDDNTGGGGFDVTTVDNRKATFTLSLKGYTNKSTYSQIDTSRARITPLFTRPSENTLCSSAIYSAVRGTSSQETDLASTVDGGLVCGQGGGDTITGNVSNDILEAGDSGDSKLIGGGGNDVLRGTDSNDVLEGGDGDDILIGRAGNDSLDGGAGKNDHLPGLGIDTVEGQGLDIVFFEGNQSDYTISDVCTTATCTVTKTVDGSTVSIDTLNSVEILIFKDGRFDPTTSD